MKDTNCDIEKNVDLCYTWNIDKYVEGLYELIKQSKTKLNLIRLEGLCKLILNKYDEDDVVCWDCQK